MRLHIIIEGGESEGLNVSSPPAAPSSDTVGPPSPTEGQPATPRKLRTRRLTEGHMKSAALGRKRVRNRRETTGPQDDFEDIADAVASAADSLPFTPAWRRRKA